MEVAKTLPVFESLSVDDKVILATVRHPQSMVPGEAPFVQSPVESDPYAGILLGG